MASTAHIKYPTILIVYIVECPFTLIFLLPALQWSSLQFAPHRTSVHNIVCAQPVDKDAFRPEIWATLFILKWTLNVPLKTSTALDVIVRICVCVWSPSAVES